MACGCRSALMLHPCTPGGVWAVGGLVWTTRGQPQPRPTGTLPMPHGCPRAVHAVAVHGEIHGLSTRSPATKPTRHLRHGYGCAKNIHILHTYGLCSDKVKTVLFGLLGALQPLRDPDIAKNNNRLICCYRRYPGAMITFYQRLDLLFKSGLLDFVCRQPDALGAAFSEGVFLSVRPGLTPHGWTTISSPRACNAFRIFPISPPVVLPCSKSDRNCIFK
jgi:hypothetical protein